MCKFSGICLRIVKNSKLTVPSPLGQAQYRHYTLKLLNNVSGERLDGRSKEKHSGTRNRDTFATVPSLFRSVTPFPRKLDQIIIFLSLLHLWLSPWYSVGN